MDAILRRAVRNDMEAEAPEAIEVGSLVIDVPRHSVRVEGQEVALTALEFKLLLDLASRMGRVQYRGALLERVWGYTTAAARMEPRIRCSCTAAIDVLTNSDWSRA